MRLLDRVLPQPFVSLAILGLWLVLAREPGLGQLLLALLLALAIPLAARGLWPDRPRLRRPVLAIILFVRVVGDIIVANWQVARLVLGRTQRLRPGFMTVPLDVADPFVATLFGSIVSLTPGTVSIDIDRERGTLLVHGLDIEDEAVAVATMKARYEAPLKEIFGC